MYYTVCNNKDKNKRYNIPPNEITSLIMKVLLNRNI